MLELPSASSRSHRSVTLRWSQRRSRTRLVCKRFRTIRLLDTLIAFLKNKTLLLVLDNCEHVIAEAATVADRLLRACPNLRILATSREPLRAAGERAYRLPSLDQDAAIALFTDRAQAAHAHFAVTDESQPIIREICQHVSGIPLAIELAAARVAVLPVRTLAKAFEDRFQVLVGGERTAPQRHQTMRAAIDWSYELLTPPEQRLVRAAFDLCRRLHDRRGDLRLLRWRSPRRRRAAADLVAREQVVGHGRL